MSKTTFLDVLVNIDGIILIIPTEVIETDKMNKPSLLMILTGTKYGYTREDGVIVSPIGCLKD